MNYFKTYVQDSIEHGKVYGQSGIPIPFPELSKYTNYLQKGQSICIGGKNESGKTSLMDYVYFINVFLWWYNLPSEERPKIKFIYFSMKHSTKIKIQKWLCLFLKLEFQTLMDIPTLNNGIGKMRGLTKEDHEKIQACQSFFDELFGDCLSLIEGSMTPTGVFNRIKSIMQDYGKLQPDGSYIYNKENEKMITIVYLDTVDQLLTESDTFQMLDSNGIKKKMFDYFVELRKIYNLTSIVIAPSKPMLSRSFKETEPTYKEAGVFGAYSDLTLIMYNPHLEGNFKYSNYETKDFIINKKNRLRTVAITRNTNGISQISKGLLFLGENGYLAEAPSSHDEEGILNVIEILSQL